MDFNSQKVKTNPLFANTINIRRGLPQQKRCESRRQPV